MPPERYSKEDQERILKYKLCDKCLEHITEPLIMKKYDITDKELETIIHFTIQAMKQIRDEWFHDKEGY